jgi:Zn-finger protein
VGPPKFFPTRKIKADASIHGKNGHQLNHVSACLHNSNNKKKIINKLKKITI